MKFTIKIQKEVNLWLLAVKARIWYWEDAIINGVNETEKGDNIPCKEGNLWCLNIIIDTGQIINWTKGVTAKVHYKVCDELSYEILDTARNIIESNEDVYVPDTLSPSGRGYGDYMIMDIDENGYIKNWKFNIYDFFPDND